MVRTYRLTAAAVLLASSLAAISILRGAELPVTLRVAGRASANVSIAARDSVVASVWSASAESGPTDLFAAVSRDGGATFSVPVRVNSTAGQVNVNGEQPPRIAIVARSGAAGSPDLKVGPTTRNGATPELKLGPTPGPAPAIVVVWTAKGPSGTMLLTSRSDDGGKTFGRSTPIPGGEAAGNRGWEGVTTDARGRVNVVWLDHRGLVKEVKDGKEGGDMAAMHHHTSQDPAPAGAAKPDGVAMAQQSRLYFAALGDPGSVRALTGGVCYCCKTAVATGAADLVALAWRHVYPGNLRDIAFSMSRDGGKTFGTPLRVSEDKWQLEGCPDDGPSMVIDGKGVAHILWPTISARAEARAYDSASARADRAYDSAPIKTVPTIGLFYASSRDGKAFSARVQVPTEGVPHHPQLAVAADGSIAAVWDELAAGTRRIAFAKVTAGADGKAAFARQVISGAEPGLYPIAAASGTRFVTAWTSGVAPSSVIRIDRR